MTAAGGESGVVRRKVLVTGASGFIGFHCLAPLVRLGYDVVATYNRGAHPDVEGVSWVQADLLTPGAPAQVLRSVKPQGLVHLAWFVEPGKMITSEDNLRWVSASYELLREFHVGGGERCVFGGSCYEYDWRYGYCSETVTPRIPDTLYGAAKNGLADTMLAYCAAAGLSGAWARMFFLYGPREGQKRLVPSVITSLLRNQPALSSHGMQIRDYMHVQDAADGIVALFASPARGAYNIASGQAITIRSIVESIGETMGKSELVRIGALPARANDTALVVADTAKTTAEVGWQAQIPLQRGLRETIAWWQANFVVEQNR